MINLQSGNNSPALVEIVVQTKTPADWLRSNYKNLLEADDSSKKDKEFAALVQTASQSGPGGDSARQALCYTLINAGQPFGDKHANWAQESAAAAINELSKTMEFRKELLPTIETALTAISALSAKARRILLGALMICTGTSLTASHTLPSAQAGHIVTKAMDLEIKREVLEQSEIFMEELLYTIRMLKTRECLPALDAIAALHKSQRLRDQARQLAAELRDSIFVVWEETVPDQLSSPEHRMLRLAVLRNSTDEREIVQAMFSNLKGYAPDSDQDQDVHIAQGMLTHHMDRVELAACLYFIETDRYLENMEIFKRVALVVADKSVNVSNIGLVADALNMLSRLEAKYAGDKERMGEIHVAKHLATMQFLGGGMF